jgi:hypothetical protein
VRANVYGRHDQEVMVSEYSEKLARLYQAQVDLYRLVIEDAETSKIEAAVSRVATLSFELTEMPDIPETVKEWHERIMERAFPKNAISGSPNSAARQRAAATTAPRLTDNRGSGPARPTSQHAAMPGRPAHQSRLPSSSADGKEKGDRRVGQSRSRQDELRHAVGRAGRGYWA